MDLQLLWQSPSQQYGEMDEMTLPWFHLDYQYQHHFRIVLKSLEKQVVVMEEMMEEDAAMMMVDRRRMKKNLLA